MSSELAEILRADPYLGSLGDQDMEAFAAGFELAEARDGDVLVRAGESAEAMLLLLSGEVSERGLGPDERRLGPGSWLGGFSGVEAGGGVVTVVAAGDIRLARYPRAAYRDIHDDRPAVRLAIGLSFGAQLARAFRRLTLGQREWVAPTEEPRIEGVASRDVPTHDYDVAVIGAGPHAIAYATWIKQDRPQTRIALVDKRGTPGFKIGESTLGPTVRALASLGADVPTMRRLMNNKIGLHFWWMGEDSDDIQCHVDQVIEETFQLERRVFETLMLEIARRAGVDVYQGTKVLIGESRIEGQPKELACEDSAGDRMRLRSKIVCDASGPAAVIGRHLGLRRKNPDFNTNAYFGYFRKRSDPGLAGWDVAATRHLCFPEGWVWFIELASWEQAPDENLQAMVAHLLDIAKPDESAYPTRYELAERFDCALDQFPVSIGVVPRTDIDSAAELPLEDRFQHYVDRYPAFARIMAGHELIDEPYEGHPSYVAYTDLVQHSDSYAGDGWLLVGDAAYFVNPFYSPGLTYGHACASSAARETVKALESEDFSSSAFAGYDEAARGMYEALVTECEAFYRSFRHPDAYEQVLLFKVAFAIGRQYERIAQFGGVTALRHVFPVRPMGPPKEQVMNPEYVQNLQRIVEVTRELEAKGADPEQTGEAVKAIVGPFVEELQGIQAIADLHLGQAFQNYDDLFRRIPAKPDWDSLVPTWRCPTCENFTPAQFEACYVCGTPAPPGAHRPIPPPPGPPGGGPPGGPPGAGPPRG